jgi:hypothetical protein
MLMIIRKIFLKKISRKRRHQLIEKLVLLKLIEKNLSDQIFTTCNKHMNKSQQAQQLLREIEYLISERKKTTEEYGKKFPMNVSSESDK